MSIDWLSVQSFQNSQDLLAAINGLSIHLKLEKSGLSDANRSAQAATARAELFEFLESLEPVIDELERGEAKPLLGVDPRLRQLAKNFLAAKRNQRRFRSVLFQNRFSRFKDLLASKTETAQDRESLLESLRELRVLIEEHVHTDSERVLSEF